MTKKKKGVSSMSKTKGSSMQRKNIGGLGDYIVQKEELDLIIKFAKDYKLDTLQQFYQDADFKIFIF